MGVGSFEVIGRDSAQLGVETRLVESGNPFQGGELHFFKSAPGAVRRIRVLIQLCPDS